MCSSEFAMSGSDASTYTIYVMVSMYSTCFNEQRIFPRTETSELPCIMSVIKQSVQCTNFWLSTKNKSIFVQAQLISIYEIAFSFVWKNTDLFFTIKTQRDYILRQKCFGLPPLIYHGRTDVTLLYTRFCSYRALRNSSETALEIFTIFICSLFPDRLLYIFQCTLQPVCVFSEQRINTK